MKNKKLRPLIFSDPSPTTANNEDNNGNSQKPFNIHPYSRAAPATPTRRSAKAAKSLTIIHNHHHHPFLSFEPEQHSTFSSPSHLHRRGKSYFFTPSSSFSNSSSEKKSTSGDAFEKNQKNDRRNITTTTTASINTDTVATAQSGVVLLPSSSRSPQQRAHTHHHRHRRPRLTRCLLFFTLLAFSALHSQQPPDQKHKFHHALVPGVLADDDNPITVNFNCDAKRQGCCDQHEWCRFWATIGECLVNRVWMEANCQLACNSCDKPRRITIPTLTSTSRGGTTSLLQSRGRRPLPSVSSTDTLQSLTRQTLATPAVPNTREGGPASVEVEPVRALPSSSAESPQVPSSPQAARTPVERCRQIRDDPAAPSAEVLIREQLVFAVEDTSGRQQMLSADQVVRSNIASACVPRLDEAECERSLCYNLYFRTMDGTCNNLEQPLRGAAFRPYSRLMPPEYDGDGLSEPADSISRVRPTPREANRAVLASNKAVLIPEFNALLMQFGQLMSHDLAKTTLVPSAKCSVCENIPGRCMAVFIRSDDPNEGFKNDKCLRVSRSSAICGSGNAAPRQQLNENTGFIDASPIYGSSIGDMHKFREGRTGFLKLKNFNGMELLPFDSGKCSNAEECQATFVAGDSRVNLFLGLTSYHLLLTREHNRLAARLQRLNPHWSGDRVFHEARKIVGAEVQAICYREYLPKVLGALFASTVGPYRGYDPNVDPTVANEFTSGAYRFGHGMIQNFYPRLDERNQSISAGGFPFENGTLHSDRLIFQGGIDPIIRGMMATQLKRPQRLTNAVTEHMFSSTDLGTINIQRGRDHGLPPYQRFRKLCGLSVARNFDDLSREILSPTVRETLQRTYGSVDNIDFYVGALVEDPVVRGLVGPTMACVVGPQFARTRDGDRFYYENPGIFTRAQLAEIRRSSLARIICDNGDNMQFVSREAFRTAPTVSCGEIPQMDLTKWKE